MFKILFDSSLNDEEKKKKAAENLVFLSRDEAGAERIFREGGTAALSDLVDSKNSDIKLAAIRTISGICNGHQARVSFCFFISTVIMIGHYTSIQYL